LRLSGQGALVVTSRPGSRLWLALRLALPLSLLVTTALVPLWLEVLVLAR